MNLGESVSFPSLEGVLCVGESLYSLFVPSGFSGRGGSEVSMGSIFSWGVLAATDLVGGRDGAEGVRARAKFRQGLVVCSMAITTLLVVGSVYKGLEQDP